MNADDYRDLIIAMINELDESEKEFLHKIFTIIKVHLDKKRGH